MLGLMVIALSIGTAASEGAQGGGKTARHAGGARRLRLSGQVRGTWVRQPGVPDVGGTYQLSGSGSNSQGSLTLALTGRMQHGFSQPPTRLVFSVTSGTGR